METPRGVNGIDFSIEDSSQYTTQLREDAVNAALEKAQHFATLTGVTLGKLVYVTDVSDSPIVQPLAESRAFAHGSGSGCTGDRHKRRIARSHPDRTRRIRHRVAVSEERNRILVSVDL